MNLVLRGMASNRGLRERLTCVVLLLFPVAGFLFRHWTSTLFVVLALLLGCLRRNWRGTPLSSPEKILLWLMVAYFASFVLSAAVNGAWQELASRLGIELRVLFFIPLYLLVREVHDAYRWLIGGCVAAAFVGFGQALYEAFWLGQPVVTGVYGNQIVVGTVHALYAVLLMDHSWMLRREPGPFKWLFVLASLMSLIVTVLAGSRGGYIALIGMSVTWACLRLPTRHLSRFIVLLLVAAAATYVLVDRVQLRIDFAVQEVKAYLAIENPARYGDQLPSQGQRLEMWKAASKMFLDNPLFGVGRHRYQTVASEYVEQGLVHPNAAMHAHPHNAYLEMAASKGVVGLVVFLAVLGFPLMQFVRARNRTLRGWAAGALVVTGYALASITESSPFTQGSFISIFLVFLAVCFSTLQSSLSSNSETRITSNR